MKLFGKNRFGAVLFVFFLLVLTCASFSASAREDSEQPSHVNFNFDQVDLRLLIKLVGDVTGRRFVLEESMRDKKVTIVTPTQIPVAEVYPLFLSTLESRGYSVVEKSDIHHIVALAERSVPSAPVITAGDSGDPRGLVTKIIRLQNINAVDLRKTLEPMVRGGKSGALAAFGPSNHLIITETVETIRRIERIIAELDQPGSAYITEVVKLKHASAEDLAQQIMIALKGAGAAGKKLSRHLQDIAQGKGALPESALVVPAGHANLLVMVGAPAQLAQLRQLVEKLDVEGKTGTGRLHALFLKYLPSEEAAKSLNALLAKSAEGDSARKIAIEPNISNNALLIDAAPRDFEWVKALVEQLDQMPQQVLVEIIIAELAVGKNLDLGFEWATIEAPSEGRTTLIGRSRPGDTDQIMDLVTQGVFPQGLTLGIARGTITTDEGLVIPRVPVLLRALSEDRDVNILSHVPLWAQNNTEASVNVVENIPVLRSTIEGGSGTARDVIQNIDRLDVGIKLTVTARVNPENEVTLELNPSIEAIIDEGPANTLFTPTIAKREVSTTVTVPDRATVAISGLIREDKIDAVSKVPILGDIPLLGLLFQRKSKRVQRTNLLIFVTPNIVTDIAAAESLKAQWQERTSLRPDPVKQED